MKYYWTSEYNSGRFYYWKAIDINDLLKQVKELYSDKSFDYGETIENVYLKGQKYE